ncbi:uncharacterized protein CCOS01_00134 [Colletotrichum costaricense]|uniref:Zn(2)-C6 fungal-type domain-containing protein n=1 Tax=Colletotrichum costaricense TaxID=1209916 RepID=A0AAI9Z8I3_9PEZI|nr:uncharacterized protein CCOS01_00134 [Colletotrichum costaricense]KAK1538820.1 hypothetical protein CCOS01_00134 [Colletotrichum costaricense]
MARRSKQKSCFACVEAKRRCDQSLPACSRCLDKEVVCTYPTVRRSRQAPISSHVSSRLGSGWDIEASWPGSDLDNIGVVLDEALFAPVSAPGPAANIAATTMTATSSSSTSSAAISQITSDSASRPDVPNAEGLNWFLQSTSWTIDYQREAPVSIPPAAVFTNFIRGLQSWLVRFLHKGYNPFIHQHLYSETTMPQCIQDAYAAIAIAQTITPDNEHVVDAVSSNYIMTLLAANSADEAPFLPILSTRQHLARTQALLIHLLLCLFSPSIPRRSKAENLIDTLRLWARQLWESAALDATTSPVFPNFLSRMSCTQTIETDVVTSLYQAFILSESIRRTFLLTSMATGVYTSLKETWTHDCAGDVCITLRGELWEASSSARWEAAARKEDPLFLHSLKGQSLVARGIRAAEVDEFARLMFTLLWGLEKVDQWVVSTGDCVSVNYGTCV